LLYFVLMSVCAVCGETPKVLRLVKCVICFRQICEGCALRRYAKVFCSEDCSKTFFFDEGDFVDEE